MTVCSCSCESTLKHVCDKRASLAKWLSVCLRTKWFLVRVQLHKSNFYERNWSEFDRENFILHYFSSDWKHLLKTDGLNVDNSTKMYLDKINVIRYLCTS